MRLKFILRSGLAAGALVLPCLALALGLGRLTVQSSLGQPLSARIELTSVTKEELDSLTAKIADPALYRQNNLGYQAVLSRARITLEQGANGQAFLTVTTQGTLNEPYLDLMVELNWAAGRLVREYTFLLDPPGVAAPPPVEPVAPLRTGAAPARSAPAATPAPARTAPSAAPPASAAALAPMAAPPPRSPAAAAPSAAAPRASASGGTYAVKRGDTLSGIAAEHKAPSATLEQMLIAIYKTNPGAFDSNNINRLRAGAILNIPSSDEVVATPPVEASKAVKVHSDDWHAYRDRVAATAPQSERLAGRAAGGKIGTVVEETTPGVAPGRDQLRVSRVTEQGAAGANAAAEEAIARNRQIKEAQDRIADLEKTVKELQRAAEVKSQALAMLQAQAESAKGSSSKSGTAPAASTASPATGATPPSTTSASPGTPSGSATTSASTASPTTVMPAPVAPPASTASAPPASTTSSSAPATQPPPDKTGEPAKATTASEPVKAAEPAAASAPKADDGSKAPAKATAKSSEPAPPPAKGGSMTDELLSSAPTWGIGIGAILLAIIAVLLAARRRKVAKYEEIVTPDTDIKTNTVFGSTGGNVVNTGDNSLSSEFSREGLGGIDTDEVDPIAEAEVYLAYGRDAQAEEILREALKKDPQRQEIYLKLLEIHSQHNKPSAFEAVASELYTVSQGEGETWQKAVALGRQLDPANPMYSGAVPGAAAAGAAGLASDAHRFSVPPDLKPELQGATTLSGDENFFDRALDDDMSLSPPSQARAPADGQGSRSASAAGAGFGHATAAEATAQLVSGLSKSESIERQAAARRDATDFESDLDFQLDESEKPAPLRAASSTAAPSEAAIVKSGQAQGQALDLDKLDFEFHGVTPTFEDPTPSVLDGQWHDSATKLDLAKAYQEMGDVEGAREILREVLAEGDDEQKTEAKALIAKLA